MEIFILESMHPLHPLAKTTDRKNQSCDKAACHPSLKSSSEVGETDLKSAKGPQRVQSGTLDASTLSMSHKLTVCVLRRGHREILGDGEERCIHRKMRKQSDFFFPDLFQRSKQIILLGLALLPPASACLSFIFSAPTHLEKNEKASWAPGHVMSTAAQISRAETGKTHFCSLAFPWESGFPPATLGSSVQQRTLRDYSQISTEPDQEMSAVEMVNNRPFTITTNVW